MKLHAFARLGFLSLLISAAVASSFSPAFAAKKKHPSRPANEKFSALEQEAAAPASEVAPAPGAAPAPAIHKVTSPAPSAILPFDPVPAEQVDAIAKRLQLTETLIRKFGRAYDYRVYTVKQLESTLAQLEAEKSAAESQAELPSSDGEI